MNARQFALKNVAWSVAVQHGPGNIVFRDALRGKQPSREDDASIIRAVYQERSNVNKYFPSSTNSVKNSVRNRFTREEADALKLLEV